MADASPQPCDGGASIFHGIPYLLFPEDPARPPSPITNTQDNRVRFWIHVALVVLGLLLAVITFFSQLFKPAPYGKHAEGSERFQVPIRFAYLVPGVFSGIVLFTLTYFVSGQYFDQPYNILFYCLFTVHYIHRSIIHPLVARYSLPKVGIWIAVATILVNSLFHYTNAEFVGSVLYCEGYAYDPRFILGLILFIVGFAINRAADFQLICLRSSRRDNNYLIPKGPLFYFISCPNYFGEGLQWFGWTIMTWSLAGLVWWLFTEATFVPRARHNHKWYRNQFPDYPPRRKALIPFIY